MKKVCRRCHRNKQEKQFHSNSIGGRKNICAQCANTATMKRYYENHELVKVKAAEKRRKPEVKAWFRNYRLETRFGLTSEAYNTIGEIQNWCCAICGTKPDGVLHVDHCHRSGKVRGLLCRPCNTAIGLFKDDTERMKKAIKYLETRDTLYKT